MLPILARPFPRPKYHPCLRLRVQPAGACRLNGLASTRCSAFLHSKRRIRTEISALGGLPFRKRDFAARDKSPKMATQPQASRLWRSRKARTPRQFGAICEEPGNLRWAPSAWWWTQPGSNQSPPQIPCNREINRELCRIRPEEAIFAPAKAANSMLCREIPYATEQGIFGAITGNFFEEQGIFSSDQQRRKKPNQVSVRADGVFGSDRADDRPAITENEKWSGADHTTTVKLGCGSLFARSRPTRRTPAQARQSRPPDPSGRTS